MDGPAGAAGAALAGALPLAQPQLGSLLAQELQLEQLLQLLSQPPPQPPWRWNKPPRRCLRPQPFSQPQELSLWQPQLGSSFAQPQLGSAALHDGSAGAAHDGSAALHDGSSVAQPQLGSLDSLQLLQPPLPPALPQPPELPQPPWRWNKPAWAWLAIMPVHNKAAIATAARNVSLLVIAILQSVERIQALKPLWLPAAGELPR